MQAQGTVAAVVDERASLARYSSNVKLLDKS